jgi:hypothetical protein
MTAMEISTQLLDMHFMNLMNTVAIASIVRLYDIGFFYRDLGLAFLDCDDPDLQKLAMDHFNHARKIFEIASNVQAISEEALKYVELVRDAGNLLTDIGKAFSLHNPYVSIVKRQKYSRVLTNAYEVVNFYEPTIGKVMIGTGSTGHIWIQYALKSCKIHTKELIASIKDLALLYKDYVSIKN